MPSKRFAATADAKARARRRPAPPATRPPRPPPGPRLAPRGRRDRRGRRGRPPKPGTWTLRAGASGSRAGRGVGVPGQVRRRAGGAADEAVVEAPAEEVEGADLPPDGCRPLAPVPSRASMGPCDPPRPAHAPTPRPRQSTRSCEGRSPRRGASPTSQMSFCRQPPPSGVRPGPRTRKDPRRLWATGGPAVDPHGCRAVTADVSGRRGGPNRQCRVTDSGRRVNGVLSQGRRAGAATSGG